MISNQFKLLSAQRFFPLFLTQLINSFNDNFFKTAFIVLISYHLFDKFPINIELLIIVACGIFVLPVFLFSATAGQIADKFEGSRLIRTMEALKIACMVLAGIGFYTQSTLLLLLTLFFIGLQTAFFAPLKYTVMSNHLKGDELIAGNALIKAGTFISILLGTLLGGTLATLPASFSFLTPIAIFIACLGYLISFWIPQHSASRPLSKVSRNFLSDTWDLIHATYLKTELFLCILGISWFWFICTVYLTQFPAYTNEILHSKPAVIAFLMLVFAFGIALGALACNRLLRSKIEATYVPIAAIGMSIFAIDLVYQSGTFLKDIGSLSLPEFLFVMGSWRVLLDFLLIGICGGLYIVPLYAMLQQHSKMADSATSLACNNLINSLFMAAAAAISVILILLGFSITQLFLTIAIVNLAVAVIICNLLPEALVKSFLIWLFKTLYRAEVKGMENYYAAGNRVLIIANHTSFLDAALLAALLPDRLTFAIDTQIAQRWWVKYFLKIVNTYSVDPTNALAAKSLIEYLRENHHVVIFPEGRITITGSLMKIYEGPGLIADKANAPLLPIRIDGAQYTRFSYLKGKFKLRWFPKITLTVLEPQKFHFPEHISGRTRREMISAALYDIMTDTMFFSSNIHETLFQSLIHAKAVHGKKHIIVEDIERKPMNYQRLILSSLILGRYIAKMTKANEFIGLFLPNSIANVVTFFGLTAYHRIPTMLNFTAGINNLLSACNTAKIRYIFTSRKFIHLADLGATADALSDHGYKLIYLEDVRNDISIWDKVYGKLISFFPLLYYRFINGITHETQKDAAAKPAVVLFTSGSEGSPKGVVLNHANLQANRFQLIARVDFSPLDKVFNSLPMFHSLGLNTATLLPIICGIRVFMYPSPLHYRIVPEICYDTGSTIFFGTDTFLSNYAKYAHPYNFFSIRYVFAGAEKLREETRRLWMQKFGIRIMEGYGVTEASPVVAVNTSMQYKAGTVGRFMPAIKYQLKSVEGISEGGRLSIAGPNIMLGYMFAQNPCEIIPPPGGWHDTGDIVDIDEEGFIRIKGRAKRFAKIAGEMVSLTAIEEEIYHLWPDNQHAVLAKSDDKKGEIIILITNHPEPKHTTIVENFRKRGIAEIYIPRKIINFPNIPILGSGKIDYPALNQIMSEAENAEQSSISSLTS